jgi:hypothetical protein
MITDTKTLGIHKAKDPREAVFIVPVGVYNLEEKANKE